MWDDLHLFYTTHRKWSELYELHVSRGDLHAAMSTLVTRNLLRSIDKPTAESIFNFAMVETLLARLDLVEKRPELDHDLLQKALKSPMESLAQQWLNFFNLFEVSEDKIALESACVKVMLTPLRDLTCLLVRLSF